MLLHITYLMMHVYHFPHKAPCCSFIAIIFTLCNIMDLHYISLKVYKHDLWLSRPYLALTGILFQNLTHRLLFLDSYNSHNSGQVCVHCCLPPCSSDFNVTSFIHCTYLLLAATGGGIIFVVNCHQVPL